MEMESRGQKRAEVVDDMPADKRACSSHDFQPSTSISPNDSSDNCTTSTIEPHETETDASSTASVSSHSEEEAERDSTYGSWDSEDVDPRYSFWREFYRSRSYGDQSNFKKILSKLKEETDPSGQVAVLTELCKGLSFCVEDYSLSCMLSDSFSPILVKLARHDNNPDIMLLAVRAITYLCDAFPRSAAFLVRHDAVPTLCQRLTSIEYLDVAEQCLQALEKISRDQPLACLQAGAILAVLNFIDFFSTSLQRVAISTVVNICKKLPSDKPSPFMDAVPILCNLLQYEDRQLVESAALCLIKITERVSQAPENLEALCKHGMIHQATHLITLCGKSTLSVPVYDGMINLLVKLSSGSFTAFKTLHELNICSILKDVITNHDLSHSISSSHHSDGHCLQVQEILKLLNVLLPALSNPEKPQTLSKKESFLRDDPNLVQRSAITLVPLLMQMMDSGASTCICYGCLSVINNLFSLSTPDILGEVVKNCNISRFLAGVFTHRDQHVLDVALQITESCLQKLPNICLNPFMKEGVFFAIDALLTPEKGGSHIVLSSSSSNLLSPDSSQKQGNAEGKKCLCFAFDISPSPSPPKTGSCKLAENAVCNRAKHTRSNFFPPELHNADEVLTEILQKLRAISLAFNDLTSMPVGELPVQDEERFNALLQNAIATLDSRESVSTFEFIKSGIVRSLLNYLSNGLATRKSIEPDCACSHMSTVEKRFSVFTKLLFSKSASTSEDLPIMMLVRKLNSALSSLENFAVVTGPKRRNYFATIPDGRCVPNPCLKVRLIKEEGDESLRDYSKSVLKVDPLLSLVTMGKFLYPFVLKKSESSSTGTMFEGENRPTQASSDSLSGHEKSPGVVKEIFNPSTTLLEIEVSQSKAKEIDMNLPTDHPVSSNHEDYLPKLLFYLDGREIDQSMSLYQAIIQRQMEVDNDMITGSTLWTQVYTLTYRQVRKPSHNDPPKRELSSAELVLSPRLRIFWHLITSKIVSDLENSSTVYEIMLLLRCLEAINRQSFQLMLAENGSAFAEGSCDGLECTKVVSLSLPKAEFVSIKLTEKLEEQMRDDLAVNTAGMPSWCNELMDSCPFLFSFEARCKYYRLAAFGQPESQENIFGRPSSLRDWSRTSDVYFKEKFVVHRDRIMDSAFEMMDLHGNKKESLEVVFDDEVGTGLGPILEFFTLVSHEFQKAGLGLWREDHISVYGTNLDNGNSNLVFSPLGLFPRPWSPSLEVSNSIEFSEVVKRFTLLGKVVAKALQDGRVMDLHLSKAFYKLFLGQDLNLKDVQSFDPQLGRTLAEFQSIINRKRALESVHGMDTNLVNDLRFRGSKIEDLGLVFAIPGYPGYVPTPAFDYNMIDMSNLEEYVSFVVDATIKSGIQRQVEAFRSGFDQIFPLKHLQIFSIEEIERLLCGEHDAWVFNELLDHIKFDHGYTASSPQVINFLEIIQEFDHEQQRSFLQFVTGAPRLPPGGFASLNPKLTVVRKHCGNSPDVELPSVMTCANYLKLPPYSSKEKMEDKMLYAMKEGQGAFHLS